MKPKVVPMDPLQQRKIAARRLVVVENDDTDVRSVYQVRRVEPLDLLRAGVASVPSLENASKLAEEVAQFQERELRLSEVESPEQRAAVEAELANQRAHLQAQMEAAVLRDTKSLEALTIAIDAFVLLGVEALGIALPEVPTGLQPLEATPETVCAPFAMLDGRTMHLRPCKVVVAPPAPGADELWIRDLSPAERGAIAGAVREAFFGASRVARTFRGEPADGRAAGRVGEAVQQEPVGVPGAVAGAPGDRGDRVPPRSERRRKASARTR